MHQKDGFDQSQPQSADADTVHEDPKGYEWLQKVTFSGPKENALRALAAGSTITEAARHADVARKTVSQWLNHDPQFRASLWLRRSQIWSELRSRVADQARPALDLLVQMLSYNHWPASLAAARAILALTPLRHAELPPPLELLEDIERSG